MLILILLIVGLLGSALVYSLAGRAQLDLDTDRKSFAALAEAKDALIGRAAADTSRPGSLPCPDIDNDGGAESPVTYGGACPSYIGRLPWKTLGLSDLRDGYGERLWYAITPSFRDHSNGGPLNSDTPGELDIGGATVIDNAIAIVFSPGVATHTQNRSSAISSVCSATGITMANDLCVSNYLDDANANGVPPADISFVTKLPSDPAVIDGTFNDKLLAITSDVLFSVVNIRVAKDAIAALETYRAANSYYPFANAYGSPSPYNCSSGLNRGRFPLTPSGCGQANWTVPAFMAPDGWFYKNNWNLVTHYAISKACGQLNLGSITIFGTSFDLDAIAVATCNTVGNLDTVNILRNFAGLPSIADEPVTVTQVSTNVRDLVIITGRALAQIHPCANAANCMEDAENTNGNTVYAKPSRYPTSNDRMGITCASSSPCDVIP